MTISRNSSSHQWAFAIIYIHLSASDSVDNISWWRLRVSFIVAPRVVENSHGKTFVPLCVTRSVSGGHSSRARPKLIGGNHHLICTQREMKRQRYTCSNKKATLRQSVSDHPLTHLHTASGATSQTICHYGGREWEMCAEVIEKYTTNALEGCTESAPI